MANLRLKKSKNLIGKNNHYKNIKYVDKIKISGQHNIMTITGGNICWLKNNCFDNLFSIIFFGR